MVRATIQHKRGVSEHTDNQRDHGRSISSGRLKTLDELLDLPDLDILLSSLLSTVRHLGDRMVVFFVVVDCEVPKL